MVAGSAWCGYGLNRLDAKSEEGRGSAMRRHRTMVLVLAWAFLLAGCGQGVDAGDGGGAGDHHAAQPTASSAACQARACSFEVVNSWPHDPGAYTQGLVYYDGRLFESTGLNGRSSLREVELATGSVLRRVDLPEVYFAEGMTIFGDRIYQLTWQSRKGFVYDLRSFQLLSEFAYEGEGWGLTHDGRHLIMSDGTSRIRFLDPGSLAVLRTVDVLDNGQPVTRLNELEYVRGEIYANVWQTDRIARIDPQTGAVLGWIDLTGLLRPEDQTPTAEVLNGIAYDAAHDRLFVTGKFWPRLYQIRLKPMGG